jgi:hypothetical protein
MKPAVCKNCFYSKIIAKKQNSSTEIYDNTFIQTNKLDSKYIVLTQITTRYKTVSKTFLNNVKFIQRGHKHYILVKYSYKTFVCR